MCRILYMESKNQTDVRPLLKSFARMAENSREYQGHGWGCSWLEQDTWNTYWSIRPVWEDQFNHIPATKHLLVHARSAFQDKGINIRNNMPFIKNDLVFVFNGELQGVRIKEIGRIGAEKIFNFILRFYENDLFFAVRKAVPIIVKRTHYIRAMNFIIASMQKTIVATQFSEQQNYFTMYAYRSSEKVILCSEPLDILEPWEALANQTIKEIAL